MYVKTKCKVDKAKKYEMKIFIHSILVKLQWFWNKP